MTNSNNGADNQQEIYAILAELARRQLTTQEQIEETQIELRSLANDITRVLGRDAVLNEVVLELRDSHETMRENFVAFQQEYLEHKRTTNAALNSLEAINLRLIQIISGEQN